MILLDTNVVSELMSPRPDRRVVAWARLTRDESLGTTSVSVGETLAGIARMPNGRHRRDLRDRADSVFTRFRAATLPFDLEAAEYYAEVLRGRFALGRPITVLDAQIAAICLAHDATLATRNVRDFDGTGVRVVDPWAISP